MKIVITESELLEVLAIPETVKKVDRMNEILAGKIRKFIWSNEMCEFIKFLETF